MDDVSHSLAYGYGVFLFNVYYVRIVGTIGTQGLLNSGHVQ
jgi:hypothetical protein